MFIISVLPTSKPIVGIVRMFRIGIATSGNNIVLTPSTPIDMRIDAASTPTFAKNMLVIKVFVVAVNNTNPLLAHAEKSLRLVSGAGGGKETFTCALVCW